MIARPEAWRCKPRVGDIASGIGRCAVAFIRGALSHLYWGRHGDAAGLDRRRHFHSLRVGAELEGSQGEAYALVLTSASNVFRQVHEHRPDWTKPPSRSQRCSISIVFVDVICAGGWPRKTRRAGGGRLAVCTFSVVVVGYRCRLFRHRVPIHIQAADDTQACLPGHSADCVRTHVLHLALLIASMVILINLE